MESIARDTLEVDDIEYTLCCEKCEKRLMFYYGDVLTSILYIIPHICEGKEVV